MRFCVLRGSLTSAATSMTPGTHSRTGCCISAKQMPNTNYRLVPQRHFWRRQRLSILRRLGKPRTRSVLRGWMAKREKNGTRRIGSHPSCLGRWTPRCPNGAEPCLTLPNRPTNRISFLALGWVNGCEGGRLQRIGRSSKIPRVSIRVDSAAVAKLKPHGRRS